MWASLPSDQRLNPQILLQIHLLAQNPGLSLVSTACHANLFAPYVTPAYVAEYLLSLYASSPASAILVKALRHPVCTVEVASSIQRIWDRRRGHVPPADDKEDKGKRKDGFVGPGRSPDSRSPSPSPPPERPAPPSRPALSVSELPRRLFRNLNSGTLVPPLLKYLFDTYTPSANSHNGYPLSRAVLSKNKEVISYLLLHGAEPGLRDGLAVEIAVKLGDIQLVRMLVDNEQGKKVDITPKFVELAVRSGSDQIVQYFVHDKGEHCGER